MSILIAIHVLAALVWVGGLFFLLQILRPAAAAVSAGERLPLFANVLSRFFPWVWVSVIALLATGYAMIGLLGGMAAVPVYVHVMQGLAWVMILIFGHVFFAPWRRIRKAVAAGARKDAGRDLECVRMLATVVLVLGLVVVVVAAGGRYGWF